MAANKIIELITHDGIIDITHYDNLNEYLLTIGGDGDICSMEMSKKELLELAECITNAFKDGK